MDSLLNVYGIVACTIAAVSVLALVVAAFVPRPTTGGNRSQGWSLVDGVLSNRL
jgi:hypothetical protein